MCFTTAGGTVGKYRRIVAIRDVVEQSSGSRFVHIALRSVLVKDFVEAKCLVLDSLAAAGNDELGEALGRVVFRRVEYTAYARQIVPFHQSSGIRTGIGHPLL